MKNKRNLLGELEELNLKFTHLDGIMEEVWVYHPSNPDFVNPIRFFEELSLDKKDIEDEISRLESEINSLN